MDYVRNLDAGRTGRLASLAVHAVFQVLIIEEGVLQPEPLPVRSGLFRAGEERVQRYDRAIGRTDGAFDALLEIVEADVLLLHVSFPLGYYPPPALRKEWLSPRRSPHTRDWHRRVQSR